MAAYKRELDNVRRTSFVTQSYMGDMTFAFNLIPATPHLQCSPCATNVRSSSSLFSSSAR